MPTLHYVSRAFLEEEFGISCPSGSGSSSTPPDLATLLRRHVAAARPLPSSAARRKARSSFSPDDAREGEKMESEECASRYRPSDTSPSSTSDTTDKAWASGDGDDDGDG